jgi:SAM-dependent methyltransferase
MKFCPCCDREYDFREFGVIPRSNALCPGCGSLERHRLLWLYLKARTDFFSRNIRVLHLAPEEILQKAFRHQNNLQYVSGDLQSPDVSVALDITRLPFRDEVFDVILCCHVLEHIPDDRAAMRELRRVLSGNGWAILQVPMDSGLEKTFEDPAIITPQEREKYFGQWDHVRLYGRDYGKRLEESGFQVRVDGFCSELDAGSRERFSVLNEDIYFCRRMEAFAGREDW